MLLFRNTHVYYVLWPYVIFPVHFISLFKAQDKFHASPQSFWGDPVYLIHIVLNKVTIQVHLCSRPYQWIISNRNSLFHMVLENGKKSGQQIPDQFSWNFLFNYILKIYKYCYRLKLVVSINIQVIYGHCRHYFKMNLKNDESRHSCVHVYTHNNNT